MLVPADGLRLEGTYVNHRRASPACTWTKPAVRKYRLSYSLTLSEAIHTLDEFAGDPRTGLPEELFLFVSRTTPLINVDLLIQDEHRRSLLTWRNDEYYGAGWHVPGGIIRYKETAAERIQAVARKELGASVDFDAGPLAVIESFGPTRNRGHFISLLYRCRLTTAPDPHRQAAAVPPPPGSWSWHAGPPADLIEVHNMYRRFLDIA
jgi:ADP-ribose pyrophosphatase YjhB (NUDIX family)